MKTDIYQEVTDQIIEAMENGDFSSRTWARNGLPCNAVSKKHYNGINLLILSMLAHKNGWSNRWMTYKQASEAGYQVKKGSKGARVVFFKPWEVTDKNNPEGEKKTIPVLRQFAVFNASQIDGMPEIDAVIPEPSSVQEMLCVSSAQGLLNQANIIEGGDSAFYRPSTDNIHMPEKSKFSCLTDWYATALHELCHWTGPRLDRSKAIDKYPVNERYAREELVAELGSAFISSAIGFDGLVQQHASYLDSWLSILKSDNRAIFRAAAMAQKAADFIQKEQTEEIFTELEEATA